MRETKYHAYLDSEERTILLHSLVKLKNQLISDYSYLAGLYDAFRIMAVIFPDR